MIVLYQDTAVDADICWEDEEKDTSYILMRKEIGEIAAQAKLNSPIAVREYYENLIFYPVTSEPLYTIPFTFETDGTGEFFRIRDCFHGNLPKSDLIRSDEGWHSILECNGLALEDFLNTHAELITLGSKGRYPVALISANKNETFTFGGAERGKEWNELEVSADIEYYKLYNSVQCKTTRNEKGYFVIDTTNLQKGLYYVSQLNLLIEFI